MEVSQILDAVNASEQYKAWSKEHSHCYLAHIFYMIEGEDIQSFDVGYFDKDTQKMTSFSVDVKLSDVKLAGESEVFKKPGAGIAPLNPYDVKVEGEAALETAAKCQQEKYPKEKPFKTMVILQNLEEGQVWNITYITQTFKTLNMKIDASSGEVLVDKMVELIQMGK